MVDAANDYAFAKTMDGRWRRRRIAAAGFIPAAFLVGWLAGTYRSWAIAVAGMVVIAAGLYVYSERPGIPFRP